MKKLILSIVAGCIVAVSFNGCSRKLENLNKKTEYDLKQIKSYKNAINKKLTTYQEKAKRVLEKRIEVSFYKESVALAIAKTAEYLGINCDKSFIPAKTYRITTTFKGTLGEFLDYVYRTTGVKYKYRRDELFVANQDLLEESIEGKQCYNNKPNIEISLKSAPVSEILKYFADSFGYSFSFNTKYSNIINTSYTMPKENIIDNIDIELNKMQMMTAPFYYKGCDSEEALKMFLRDNNLVSKKIAENKYEIRDFAIANINIPTYFDYSYQSGSGLESMNNSSGTGSKVSISERGKDTILKLAKIAMSPLGQISVSNRGYITIIDKPINVAQVKNIIRKEIMSQVPIDLSIDIIRIDTTDNLQSGIDWNLLAKSAFSGFGIEGRGDFNFGLNTVSNGVGLDKGLVITATKDGLNQMLAILQEYGNAKIVRQYNAITRSGLLNSFKAVDQIPYVTTSTTNQNGISQTSGIAKFAEAGLIINILPTISKDGEKINIATDIVVSEYLGDKLFTINGDEYRLPQITSNEIQAAGQINIGESIILTGFKLKNVELDKNGIPEVSQNDYLGWMFGYQKHNNKVSHFIIVITPKSVKDI